MTCMERLPLAVMEGYVLIVQTTVFRFRFNCYDFGGSDRVELLEKFAFSWINLAIMQGVGRNMAFKVVKR